LNGLSVSVKGEQSRDRVLGASTIRDSENGFSSLTYDEFPPSDGDFLISNGGFSTPAGEYFHTRQ
jgi:hypothetical protein